MTDISKRIKALFFLRAIFLLSLVAGLGSFLVEGIALSFGEGHVFSAAGGMTIYVLTTIFTILRLLAIVLVAATLVLTVGINGECKAAFWTAIGAAVTAIASGILLYLPATRTAGWVVGFVADLGLAGATFLLIDGIFDRKARGTPLFGFAVLGIALMVVSSICTLLTYFVKAPEALLGAVYSASQVTHIVYCVILFLAIHSCLKEGRSMKESEAIE